MGTCFVCGKTVKDNDEYEWFGCDGDRIHKKWFELDRQFSNADELIQFIPDYGKLRIE